MESVLRNPMRGIALKVSSVVVFLAMQTFIKLAGSDIPPGQVTFCRSFFALFPIMAYLGYRHQLRSAFYTANPAGHLKRGTLGIISMGLGFYGLLHLPLPEAIALGYATPLVAVIFAAVFLGETVRVYRWSAVCFGIVGVAIISWPKLTLFREGGMAAEQAVGALCVLLSAVLGGMAMIQVRRLVEGEKTATIVLYFSITASVFSLVTVPFGWLLLDWSSALFLIAAGFCRCRADPAHRELPARGRFHHRPLRIQLDPAWRHRRLLCLRRRPEQYDAFRHRHRRRRRHLHHLPRASAWPRTPRSTKSRRTAILSG